MTEPTKPQRIYYTCTTAEFKEQCLEIIAELVECDGEVIIFDGDEPVVQITRYQEVHDPLRGSLKGRVQIHGDIVSPLPPEWYALSTDQDEEWYGPYTGQDEERPA